MLMLQLLLHFDILKVDISNTLEDKSKSNPPIGYSNRSPGPRGNEIELNRDKSPRIPHFQPTYRARSIRL